MTDAADRSQLAPLPIRPPQPPAHVVIGVVAVLVVVIALLDFATSANFVGSILFTLPLTLCAFQRSTRVLWITATTTAVLTIAAERWGLDRVREGDVGLFNRVLLVACLGTLAGFIHRSIGKKAVQRSSTLELERQRRALAVTNEKLAQMEGRYRGLLEAAPDAMVLTNQAGAVVLVNRQAENLFGYARGELEQRSPRSLLSPDSTAALIAYTRRTEDGAYAEQSRTPIELDGRRKDQSNVPIEVMLSHLQTSEGVLLAVSVRDITARRKAQTQLVETMLELQRSNAELAQFAYIASHDLQEPLRMVASYTQLLAKRYKGKLDADADEFIAFAVGGANRMQQLIQDLLVYSRVHTRGERLTSTSSELALEQATVSLRDAIAASGALVTHGPLPNVMADQGQLVQLFQNLVGNAIKYQPAGVPTVHISSVESDGGKWMFSVHDNGIGIEAQYFEKIFVMFQRLHKREDFEGSGIGLAICKKIVERHNGSISVESELGHGSTFRFALTAA